MKSLIHILSFIGWVTHVCVASASELKWIELSPRITDQPLYSVFFTNHTWVATGANGVVSVSSNAWRWLSRSLTNGITFSSVTYANGKWMVAGSKGNLWSSSNANVWIQQTLQTELDLREIAYGADTWVVVGGGSAWETNAELRGKAVLFVSRNGHEWIEIRPDNPGPLYSVQYARGRWVAAGAEGGVLVSLDGLNWERASSATNSLHDLTYLNGSWFATSFIPYGQSRGGILLRSDDGENWEIHSRFGDYYVSRPACANDRWIGVSSFKVVDGPFGSSVGVRTAVFFESSDGSLWTLRKLPYVNGAQAIGYGDGQWVGVGDEGFIMIAEDPIRLANLTWQRDGQELVIRWPASAKDWILESAHTLSGPYESIQWKVNLDSLTASVRVPITGIQQWFRLRQPARP